MSLLLKRDQFLGLFEVVFKRPHYVLQSCRMLTRPSNRPFWATLTHSPPESLYHSSRPIDLATITVEMISPFNLVYSRECLARMLHLSESVSRFYPTLLAFFSFKPFSFL